MTIEEIKKKKISAISLGCDKNRVDLEKMLYNLKNFGFVVNEDVEDCDILIINTCAFIQPAINEALEHIFLALELRKLNKIEKIVVTGCLNSRFENEVEHLIDELDLFVPLKENDKIVNKILGLYQIETDYVSENGRLITNLPHYAYLKIADGCDNGCAYCTIPRIRGRYKSVEQNKLIDEAKDLAKKGVKELILVAQDITRYGTDLYHENRLVALIKELSKIKGIEWIRLHYCYPEMVTKELLDEVKNNPKVCKYLDIPFQHIDEKILKDMNRRSNEQQIRNLVSNLRENYKDIAIRSTFIVGFPGETRKQFNKLIQFLLDARLDNVGFFSYSREEKTKAYYMKKQVPNFVKKLRLNKIQKVQEKIMNSNNIEKIGQESRVIIDYFDDELGIFFGRTENNSPEVDFPIFIEYNEKIKPGEIYNIKIIDYMSGMFKGEII